MDRFGTVHWRCRLPVLFCALAIGGAGVVPACGSGESDAVRLESIFKAMQAYDRQLSTIWVKYRVAEYESSKFNTARTNRNALNKSPSTTKTFPELKYEVQAELATKGNLVRASDIGPEICGGRFIRERFECISVYDGDKTVKLQDDETDEENPRPIYKLTRDRERAFGYADPLNLCGQRYILDVLDIWRSNRDGIKLTVRDEVGAKGEPVVYVELDAPKYSATTKVWLLRNRGYRVERLDYCSHGKIVHQYKDMVYEQVDGVEYPKSAVYLSRSESGDLLKESKLEVLSVTTRPSEIPNSLFKLEIPSDAALYDMDRETMIRDPAHVQAYIDEMVAPRFYRQPWFRICLCLVAIVILSITVVFRQVKRYRRQRNALAN
jgi:hypothetical protein